MHTITHDLSWLDDFEFHYKDPESHDAMWEIFDNSEIVQNLKWIFAPHEYTKLMKLLKRCQRLSRR